MQTFVVLLNILKLLLSGQHEWLAVLPGMFFIFGIRRGRWWRAVGLVERSGGNVNDTVFGQLVSPENRSLCGLWSADAQFYI